ncbi:GNAT family N-acetyltransferase [Lentilactobacillus kisonensis]|uniref:Acetyltransferase, GNAT family n=2 Tax=Lentilactobacillus kisonensis TaxID=481722 RepID=H1LC01_9LACO|nr:GNAT family N-acetyltransferase [Lentilactobacillus kisonensis]EHO54473.1 acetyltransferase, GNAT family [Lentilactobacillus kisonensis F0435]KRL21189.1 acetyltransferase, GNAT family [Lentilactobacillus kisonensis DSM 19906 = JCM 15041]
MKIVEVNEISPKLIRSLLAVWESSVKGTHLFLTDDEIQNIKTYIPTAIQHVQHLVLIANENNYPVGFMGITDQTLEMLFISNECRGKGLGKQLLTYGINKYSVNKLSVNEQNPLAQGFYEHMGFEVYKRTELDEQGNNFPIRYMKKK